MLGMSTHGRTPPLLLRHHLAFSFGIYDTAVNDVNDGAVTMVPYGDMYMCPAFANKTFGSEGPTLVTAQYGLLLCHKIRLKEH